MPHITYVIKLQVRDVPGVLVRVAHVFARRNCNIRSVQVEPHDDTHFSTMIIVVQNVPRIEQITAQLEKLIDVKQVIVAEGKL